jgi:hypothetical protein
MLTRPTLGASTLRAQLPVDLPHESPLTWFSIPPGLLFESAPRRSNCGHHPATFLFESALRIYGGRGGIDFGFQPSPLRGFALLRLCRSAALELRKC